MISVYAQNEGNNFTSGNEYILKIDTTNRTIICYENDIEIDIGVNFGSNFNINSNYFVIS